MTTGKPLLRCAFCLRLIGEALYTKNVSGGVLHFDGRDCMRVEPVLVRRELSYPAGVKTLEGM